MEGTGTALGDGGSFVLSRCLVAVPVEEKLMDGCFEFVFEKVGGGYKLQDNIYNWEGRCLGILERRYASISIRSFVVSCQQHARLCFISSVAHC